MALSEPPPMHIRLRVQFYSFEKTILLGYLQKEIDSITRSFPHEVIQTPKVQTHHEILEFQTRSENSDVPGFAYFQLDVSLIRTINPSELFFATSMADASLHFPGCSLVHHDNQPQQCMETLIQMDTENGRLAVPRSPSMVSSKLLRIFRLNILAENMTFSSPPFDVWKHVECHKGMLQFPNIRSLTVPDSPFQQQSSQFSVPPPFVRPQQAFQQRHSAQNRQQMIADYHHYQQSDRQRRENPNYISVIHSPRNRMGDHQQGRAAGLNTSDPVNMSRGRGHTWTTTQNAFNTPGFESTPQSRLADRNARRVIFADPRNTQNRPVDNTTARRLLDEQAYRQGHYSDGQYYDNIDQSGPFRTVDEAQMTDAASDTSDIPSTHPSQDDPPPVTSPQPVAENPPPPDNSQATADIPINRDGFQQPTPGIGVVQPAQNLRPMAPVNPIPVSVMGTGNMRPPVPFNSGHIPDLMTPGALLPRYGTRSAVKTGMPPGNLPPPPPVASGNSPKHGLLKAMGAMGSVIKDLNPANARSSSQ